MNRIHAVRLWCVGLCIALMPIPVSNGTSSRVNQISVDENTFRLGDAQVLIRVYRGAPGPILIRLHHNEKAAQEVAIHAVQTVGGTFIDLIHRGGRNVTFSLGGEKFAFDPNRIFTPEGLKAAVTPTRNLNIVKAREEVAKLAAEILRLTGRDVPVIALHNNTGMGYGLASYERGGNLFLGMRKSLVHRGNENEQSFIIVTRLSTFELLKRYPENLVYQDPASDLNDGSLSYVFGRTGREYFNVEAGYHDHERQWQSLRHVYVAILNR